MFNWKETSNLSYRTGISSSGGFHLNNANDIVLSGVHLCHTGKWPLGVLQTVLSNEDNVTNSEVSGALVPFVHLAQAGQVLRSPKFPKMLDKALAEVLSTEK